MVGRILILNEQIIAEPHKRAGGWPIAAETGGRPVDLSHRIESGMITDKGLPAPLICDHLSRRRSRALYAEGTGFPIGRIVARSGAEPGRKPAL